MSSNSKAREQKKKGRNKDYKTTPNNFKNGNQYMPFNNSFKYKCDKCNKKTQSEMNRYKSSRYIYIYTYIYMDIYTTFRRLILYLKTHRVKGKRWEKRYSMQIKIKRKLG